MTGRSSGFFNGLDIDALILTASGGSVSLGPELESGLSSQSVRLDRLYRAEDVGTFKFQDMWQRTVEKIESAFDDDQQQINAISVIITQLQEVINAQAQTAAVVSAVKDDLALVNSKTDPVDGLLSATSDGVVNISSHSRVYADGVTVTVTSGSLSGFTEGQFVRVYYQDAARAGGAVSYIGTTGEVTQTGATHIVGGVLIPMIGDPPSTGIGTTPPGFVRDGTAEF